MKEALLILLLGIFTVLLVGCSGKNEVEYTNTASKEGLYVIEKHGGNSVTVAAAQPSGEQENFYGLYTYSSVPSEVEVGQRVKVEPDGALMETFPYQGKAKKVTILPVYKPNTANLDEIQVVQKALQTIKGSSEWPAITSVEFMEAQKLWQVGIKLGEDNRDVEIIDQLSE
ncbi:hypothetical protein ACA30_09635 [Virgibacillus soli]|nr:hypothetical protein ACA30_09635 [Virgibacillus soli]